MTRCTLDSKLTQTALYLNVTYSCLAWNFQISFTADVLRDPPRSDRRDLIEIYITQNEWLQSLAYYINFTDLNHKNNPLVERLETYNKSRGGKKLSHKNKDMYLFV